MKKVIFFCMFIFLIMPLTSSLNFENPIYGLEEILPTEINQNITNNYNNYTYNGSTLELNDISDVNVPSPSDGESLVWSSSLMKWVSDTVISRWVIDTSNRFLYTISDTLYFDDSLLNDTIDARAGNATTDNDFHIFINSSAYNNIHYNITKGDADEVEFTIIPGKKFIFGDTFT